MCVQGLQKLEGVCLVSSFARKRATPISSCGDLETLPRLQHCQPQHRPFRAHTLKLPTSHPTIFPPHLNTTTHRPLATAPHLLFRSLRRRLGSRPGRRRLCGRSMLRKVEVLPGRHLQLLQASETGPANCHTTVPQPAAGKLSAGAFSLLLAHAEVEHDAAGANFSCRQST